MAAQQTPGGQEKPTKNTMFFHGFHCVLGTGGDKTAGRREQGREEALVSTKHRDQATPRPGRFRRGLTAPLTTTACWKRIKRHVVLPVFRHQATL